ncbi:MAG: hypothetical protein ACLRSW_08750 [Christensenellaceae bacterium]
MKTADMSSGRRANILPQNITSFLGRTGIVFRRGRQRIYYPTHGFGNHSFKEIRRSGERYRGKRGLLSEVEIKHGALENGDGVGYVYLNGMRIISYAAEASAGAVGYKTQTGVEYTAFTNDVFGTSDFEAVKNFPTKFPATAYLKGENRGFSIAGAERESGGLRVGEKQKIRKIDSEDAYAVVLGKEDWVKYGVDVPPTENIPLRRA